MTFKVDEKRNSKRVKTHMKSEDDKEKISSYTLWFLENHVKERLKALGVLE